MESRNGPVTIEVAAHTLDAYIEAYWTWIRLLASDDFDAAISALVWDDEEAMTSEQLKTLISTIYAATEWAVIVPNDRLVGVINSSFETNLEARHEGDNGWFLAHIPVSGEPERALEDDVELFGVGVSFSVVRREGRLGLCYEIVHL